jgi:hypothetical protein
VLSSHGPPRQPDHPRRLPPIRPRSTSPDYSRSGRFFEAALHDFHDWKDGQDSLLGAFFLMPTLGGGDFLRADPSYRFRDRDALLLTGEYRWAVHKMVDVAGVYEAGKVAPDVKGLSLDNLAHSVAIGIRVHSKTSNLFRADLAHGSEGLAFRIGFTAGGS